MAAASAPAEPSVTPLCGAKTRAGKPCRKVRGWATDHVGHGHCKLHGGASPNGQIHAAREHAAALALEYQCEPHVALLRAVGQAARWELVCRQRVALLQEDELAVLHEKRVTEFTPVLRREGEDDDLVVIDTGATIVEEKVETTTSATLNVWVKSHIQAVRDLASIAKTAIDAGVEERRVRLEERLATELADAIAAMLAELGLTAEQREIAPGIVRRHLVALEGGEGVAA